MSETNGKVTWPVFTYILGIAGIILITIWTKLEKIDDTLGDVKTDIAVIKRQVEGNHLMSSESSTYLDKMHNE